MIYGGFLPDFQEKADQYNAFFSLRYSVISSDSATSTAINLTQIKFLTTLYFEEYF